MLRRTVYGAFLAVKALLAPAALGVAGLVRDGQGRVLLVRHSYRPGWCLPTGGVGVGEPPDVALRRELGEEVGLAGGTLRLLGIFTTRVGPIGNVVVLYDVQGGTIAFRPNLEVRAILWADPAHPPADLSGSAARRLAELRGEDASPFW